MTNATPMEPNEAEPDGLNVINENKPKKKRRKSRRKRKNINVRTLFVGGLPMDTKPREIYLMFRKFTGYQGSILKLHGKEGKTASPVAFVTFVNREQAEAAKLELHGVRFDELIPRTLKIEFAKSNTKDATKAITTPPTVIVPSDSPVIEPQTVPLCDTTTGLLTTNDSTWSQNNTMMTDVNGNVVYPSFIPNPAVATTEESSPCTTLFVANLGHNASEEEIKQLFVRIPSFRRIKMYKTKGTKPVAFVQYCDVTSAVQAKSLFNGQMLLSSENGGIRIEFAKKPMGELL